MEDIRPEDVEVTFVENVVSVKFLGLRLSVAHTAEDVQFDTNIRRIVEQVYTSVKAGGNEVPDVAIARVVEAVSEAIRSHPDFAVWDVHGA